MLNGDPLPADVPFPANRLALQKMYGTFARVFSDSGMPVDVMLSAGADLQRLLEAYGLCDPDNMELFMMLQSDHEKRRVLEEFLRGASYK